MRKAITIVFYFVLFYLAFTQTVHAAVWQTQAAWNDQYETQYANWVHDNVHNDIFANKQSPYYGFETDCADLVYTTRLIFAYENRLPFAVRNSQAASPNTMITNDMTNWDNLPEKERLHAFVDYVNLLTGTNTIDDDTYSPVISRKYIRPGAVYVDVTLKKVPAFYQQYTHGTVTGHAYLIKNVRDSGVLEFLSSTVPPSIRVLRDQYGLDRAPLVSSAGLRVFKQPQQYDQSNSSLPGFSNEQFGFANWKPFQMLVPDKQNAWVQAVMFKLRTREETPSEKIERMVGSVCGLLQNRADYVKMTWQKFQDLKRCFNTEEYDEYSTPSRDSRIAGEYKRLLGTVGDIRNVRSQLETCQIEYDKGQFTDAYKTYFKIVNGVFSPNPNEEPKYRWGIEVNYNYSCQ